MVMQVEGTCHKNRAIEVDKVEKGFWKRGSG